MSLRKQQSKFAKDIGLLIAHAYSIGYELTFGDAYRSPRVFGPMGQRWAYGSANSNHKIRMAVDFNLFKDGEYLQTTEDHRELGEYWESLDPANRWGGRYNDGNHYERIPE